MRATQIRPEGFTGSAPSLPETPSRREPFEVTHGYSLATVKEWFARAGRNDDGAEKLETAGCS